MRGNSVVDLSPERSKVWEGALRQCFKYVGFCENQKTCDVIRKLSLDFFENCRLQGRFMVSTV